VKRETPGHGCQLDLHGVQLNEQHVGIEHIAIETDYYAGALATIKKNGARRSSKSASTTVGMCAGLLRPTARRWS
jgi:hypothetical protein